MMRRAHGQRRMAGGRALIERIRARAERAVLLVALVSSGACYTYTAVEPNRSVAQERAEFRLNDEGRVLVVRALGPGVRRVDGRIVSSVDSVWTVQVFRLETIDGTTSTWTGEVVDIPFRAVAELTVRQLDRRRSMIAAAGVTGAVAVLVSKGLFGGGFGFFGGGGDGGTVGTSLRVP
jgi:hypothetical protein